MLSKYSVLVVFNYRNKTRILPSCFALKSHCATTVNQNFATILTRYILHLAVLAENNGCKDICTRVRCTIL